VFSVVAFIYGKTAMGWLAVWFCILFSVLFAFRQVHGRGKKGLMTGKGLFRVDRRYLLSGRSELADQTEPHSTDSTLTIAPNKT
jgi:hypothetical protein